jgi:D-alanyl-D-alanine carboxypeptidase
VIALSTAVWEEVRRRPRRLLLLASLGLALAAGIAFGIDRVFLRDDSQALRPDLQRVVDGVVSGRTAIAPGATAYVSGPGGSWLGAAGVANARSGAGMRADARFRLESVSKIYTATLILQLAEEGRLRVDDTVERWLPGLLPYGDRITIRQLLTMQSGLIDNNDVVNASDSGQRAYMKRIRDPELRARILAISGRVDRNRATEFSPMWWIRLAAWQPLLFSPGSGFHYSNIGYDILGLVASRAGGKQLADLYRERIFEPLGLDATAYDPQGPIEGPHSRGYGIEPDGTRFDATDWHAGVGAEGGIVSNAEETARFLTALMRGELVGVRQVEAMKGDTLWFGGAATGCAGQAYGWSGGGSGYKTEVWVDGSGRRVAVLLVNARHWDTAQPLADAAAYDAMARLFCRA